MSQAVATRKSTAAPLPDIDSRPSHPDLPLSGAAAVMPDRPVCPQPPRRRRVLQLAPGFAGRARAWLGHSVLPPGVAAALALAGVWALAPYASDFPAVFAPRNYVEALVRDAVQSYGAECARSHGRRCASRQETEPDPAYAPLERAARKVLRHAGFDVLLIELGGSGVAVSKRASK
jgi:hypothetical protein